MNRIEDAQLFVAVADAGSVSRAARARGLAQSTVSRALARLETRVGVRLVERTTRRMRLTDAGTFYLDGLRRLLHDAQDLERGAADYGTSLRGTIRVSMCATLGRRRLLGPLLAWAREHRGVRLDVALEERRVDLVADRLDVVVRAGPQPDSSYALSRLGGYDHVLVAAPSYLARRGRPASSADLATHDCLVMRVDKPLAVWPFKHRGRDARVTVSPVLVTNDAEVLLAGVVSGHGVAVLPDYLIDAALGAGQLVALLPDHALPQAPVWAVHAPSRRLPRLVREALGCLRAATGDRR
jgi:DNA-binding transcriptional LysR family regulator